MSCRATYNVISTQRNLILDSFHTADFRIRTFPVSAARYSNELPRHVTSALSLQVFWQ